MTDPKISFEPIKVQLTDRAIEELAELKELTGISKTDLINRAIAFYTVIEREKKAGADWYSHIVTEAGNEEYRELTCNDWE